jgi:hypothetical protein
MNISQREEFGLIEVNFNNEEDLQLDTETREIELNITAAKEHIENANSFSSLIFDWITPTRSVMLVTADNLDGNEEGFIVYFREQKKDLAELVISMAWLKNQFPNILPANEWRMNEDDVEQKEWCAAVADFIVQTDDSLKVIVSYIFANYSHITVNGNLEYILEDCTEEDLESIAGKQLISVMPHFQNRETGEGFGENWWSARSLN